MKAALESAEEDPSPYVDMLVASTRVAKAASLLQAEATGREKAEARTLLTAAQEELPDEHPLLREVGELQKLVAPKWGCSEARKSGFVPAVVVARLSSFFPWSLLVTVGSVP